MNALPPLYIDVTTLSRWQRPAVGIIRVEQQLCRWLLEDPAAPAVTFVTYDRQNHAFSAVSPADVRAHLARIDRYADPTAGPPAPPSRLERFEKLVIGLVRRLPRPLHQPVFRVLQLAKPAVVGLVRQLVRLRQRLARRPPPATPAPSPPPPPAADPLDVPGVYVSLGLDWDNKDMADLYRHKRARQHKLLLFCYDIIPIKLPHLCVGDVSRYFGHYFVDLAWCADRVLCISESSRHDLRQFLTAVHAPLPDCQVVHLGADILPRADSAPVSAAVRAATAVPYILFVSTIERRKNHEILYRAYTRLAEQGVDLPPLVWVGMPGWGIAELLNDVQLDPRIQGLIHLLNHVNDAELAHLYRQARFTVYPSLYEGWGLPVAESLAFGKFCLCSNAASLPEVGQAWVEYLDPWDLPAWVERLRYYIEHPAEVDRRNAAIAAGYQPQPWAATAATIVRHALALASPA